MLRGEEFILSSHMKKIFLLSAMQEVGINQER